jgi:cytochrome c-type biogenesis protein
VTSLVLAVAAGMVTVASPCVLPMLPLVLGASIGQRHPARPLAIALGFALSFGLMVLVFSAFAQVLGLSQQGLRQAAAVLLLVFGALMLWPTPFQWLAMRAGGLTGRLAAVGQGAGDGPCGGLLLGLSLGAVWTPCAGPVLAAILTLIATEPIGARTALLLACYAAGASIPMLAIAYGGQVATTRVRQLARHAHRLQQAFGLVIVAVALAMLAGVDTDVTLWLTQHLPSISTGL